MHGSTRLFNMVSGVSSQRLFKRCKVQSLSELPVVQIDKAGDHQHKTVSIQDILHKSPKKLSLRDLRILSNGGRGDVCSILPRPNSDCIVIEILSLRLLVWKDRCLMLENPEQPLQHYKDCEAKHNNHQPRIPSPELPPLHRSQNSEAQANHNHQQRIQRQFINLTQQSLTNQKIKNINDFDNVLRLYQNSSETIEFEQKILECALSVTVEKFERHLQMLSPAVDLILQQISCDPSSNMLRRLLAVKKSLGDFESDVLNLSRILQGLLSNDEDLIGLYLTKKRTEISEHEEVELLLESYLADLDDIHSNVRRIKDRIEDTNQFIAAHLDTARNKMIRMSLFMEMGTLSIASGGLIAGIFGMNLTHGMEENLAAFYATIGGISVIMVLIYTKFRANYQTLRFDTTNAHSFKVLKNFLTYVDELEDIVNSRKDQITETEFKTALNKLVGHKVPSEEAEFIFQMFDRNKDRKIDKSELNF